MHAYKIVGVDVYIDCDDEADARKVVDACRGTPLSTAEFPRQLVCVGGAAEHDHPVAGKIVKKRHEHTGLLVDCVPEPAPPAWRARLHYAPKAEGKADGKAEGKADGKAEGKVREADALVSAQGGKGNKG